MNGKTGNLPMNYTYLSSLFSMYAKIAVALTGADKQKRNVIINKIKGVGIKFDNISAVPNTR